MNKKNILLIVLLVIFIGADISLYKKAATLKNNSNTLTEGETSSFIAEVGKIIKLPTGEIPTIATVSDLEKLKGQPFFSNAKVGDKVLLYPNAKRAYLYDPKASKIMQVAPIDLGDTTVNKTSVK